jgi:hypothetical protein
MYLHYIYWKSGTLFCAICQDIWWKHKVLGFIAVRVRVAHLFICLCVVFRFVIVSCFFVFNSVFCFCLLRSVSCVQCCPWLKNKPFCIAPSVFFSKIYLLILSISIFGYWCPTRSPYWMIIVSLNNYSCQ